MVVIEFIFDKFLGRCKNFAITHDELVTKIASAAKYWRNASTGPFQQLKCIRKTSPTRNFQNLIEAGHGRIVEIEEKSVILYSHLKC